MSYIDIAIFLCGCFGRASISLVGDLYITEILLGVSLIFYIKRAGFILNSVVARFLVVLSLLWFVNQVVTDIYMQTPFVDWSRGWAKIIVFQIDIAGLALLTRLEIGRIMTFYAGFACAFLIQSLFFPDYGQVGETFADGMWKLGLAPFFDIMAAVIGVSPLIRRLFGRAGQFIPLTVAGVANLALNFRSAFGTCIAAVAFGFLKQFLDLQPRLRARVSPITYAVVIGVGAVLSQGVIGLYATAAANNWLGESAREKFETQSGGDLSLFQAGRTESLASMQAIADSPIIGHGSWAKDIRYVAIMVDRLELSGVKIDYDLFSDPLIPTHSHILGSWVEAGIMGGVFWSFVLLITAAALYLTLKHDDVPATFVAFILFTLLWNIPFSPFSNTARISDAGSLCVIMSIYRSTRRCQ